MFTYNLGQTKWNIWTTPPPISMMPKWRVFAPSHLHHYFEGGGGGGGDNFFLFVFPRFYIKEKKV